GGFQRGVEGIFLSLSAGDVALASCGDLNALCLRVTARVGLMLQLYVEEGQRGVKAFNLCEFCFDPVGEVLWHLNIASGNGDLCCCGGVGHDLPPCDRGAKPWAPGAGCTHKQ